MSLATTWAASTWNGTAWNGSAWNGSAWNGTAWNGSAWNGARPGTARPGTGRPGTARPGTGSAWNGVGLERLGVERLGVERLGLERLGLERRRPGTARPGTKGGRAGLTRKPCDASLAGQGRRRARPLPLGCVILALALAGLVRQPALDGNGWAAWGVLVVLVTGSWIWPMMIYRGTESEAVHLDEGFFVIMALLLPAAETILVFAVATVVAQVVRRRPMVKSAFNFGQVLVAAGLALAVSRGLAAPTAKLTVGAAGGRRAGRRRLLRRQQLPSSPRSSPPSARPGASRCSKASRSASCCWRPGVAVGLLTALAVSSYRWSLPLAVVPLIIVRQVLAGHFEARHDRSRIRGLFDATLEANRSMGDGDVLTPILESARALLRCSEAVLSDVEPASDVLSAPLSVDGTADGWWCPAEAAPSRSTPPTRRCSRRWPRWDPAPSPTPPSTGRAAINGSGSRPSRPASARGSAPSIPSGAVTFLNPAATQMLGWPAAAGSAPAMPGGHARGPWRLTFCDCRRCGPWRPGRFVRNDDSIFRAGRRLGLSGRLHRVGHPRRAAEAVGAVIAFADITERKNFEEELARHAFHDALTGLANRRLFLDHLEHALRRSQRSGEVHAVLFVDIDRFKIVNDSLGPPRRRPAADGDRRPHAFDAAGRRVAGPLRRRRVHRSSSRASPASRTRSSRPSGSWSSSVVPIALAGDHEVVATVSIGIALTGDGKTRDDLLHDADVAMYQAKAKGRAGCYEIFDRAAMGARSAERLDLEASLRRGLERDELEVFYQPLYGVAEGRVVGAEALVRWRHPERGPAHPGQVHRAWPRRPASSCRSAASCSSRRAVEPGPGAIASEPS